MTTLPLPAIIGQTENALRALLLIAIEGSGIDDYEEWVALGAITGGVRPQDVAEVLRCPELEAAAVVGRLEQKSLTDPHGITARGELAFSSARVRVAEAARTVTAGIDAERLEGCADVLRTVRERADAIIASGAPA